MVAGFGVAVGAGADVGEKDVDELESAAVEPPLLMRTKPVQNAMGRMMEATRAMTTHSGRPRPDRGRCGGGP